MEMATETKTPAKVSTTTGTGNSCTQNISTVKEQDVGGINSYKERPAKLAKMQNNKAKIKISQYKRKQSHLKFFINLYLNLVLSISRINKAIINLLTTKTTTNYSYNNSSYSIINLTPQQHKLQKRTQSFNTICIKFQNVNNFLEKFHYRSQRNLTKYVKLTIINNKIRTLAGICPKRLISLKRLQQIPENHAKIAQQLSLSIQTKVSKCNYGYLKAMQLSKESKLNAENCQLNEMIQENLNALLSLKEKENGKDLKEIKACKHCQPCTKECCNIKEHKRSDLKRPQAHRISLHRHNLLNQNYCQRNVQIKEFVKVNDELNSCTSLIESGPLNKYSVALEHFIKNEDQTRGYKSNHIVRIIAINKTKFQLKDLLKYSNAEEDQTKNLLQPKSPEILKCLKEENNRLTILKKFQIQQFLTHFLQKCCQHNKHIVALDYSNVNNAANEVGLGSKYREYGEYYKKYDYYPNKKINFILRDLIINSSQSYGQLKCNRVAYYIKIAIQTEVCLPPKLQQTEKLKYGQRKYHIRKLSAKSRENCGQLNQHMDQLEINVNKVFQIRLVLTILWKHTALLNLQDEYSKIKCNKLIHSRVSLKDNIEKTLEVHERKNICHIQNKHDHLNINSAAFQSHQKNFSEILFLRKKCGQLNRNFKEQESKEQTATSTQHEENTNFSKPLDEQLKFANKFCNNNMLRRQTSLNFNSKRVEMKLAYNTNNATQFHLDDNNNSYRVESKQPNCLKKCQNILYSILLCFCCCGFPVVLVEIFKYLKDATVHVLTRRLKITTAETTSLITTSIYYNYGKMKSACHGKLKEPTKQAADYEGNQQNILKRQNRHTTAIFSSSCCLTTALTTSSSYCKSLENLKLLQPWLPYFDYHQHHHCHHYQHNRLIQQTQQQKQYDSNSTIQHLKLPSLLVFARTFILLILLSSLWHTSEAFHGSGVKLSANTVKTKYGLVRGIVVRSSPSLVEAYLGIPYASPPVGSLRFMPPITPSTWKNVRNADRFSPVCPQNVPIPPNGPEALLEVPRARLAQLRRLLPLLSNQSEDCLYLNIYVPYENRRHRRFTINSGESHNTPKLSTILFIHGESYEWNSGNPYDGSVLAARGNVIVVTINFRLGVLGFLKTGGKESAQGNFGLMDLVAGLHWLKENLPAFGGDPQQITLLGHGTGAALANILVVSPVSSDLVQHTVMVSGSALSPWAIQKNPLFIKRRVAEQTGCHGDMLYYDLAPCLRTKTVADLLAIKIDHPRFLVGFAPFVDGTVISANTDSIGKLSLPLGSAIVSTSGIEYANFPKRNLIFCLTSVESHLDLSAQDLEFGFNETRRDRILRTYVRNNFHYHLNEIFAVLKNEYTDWDKAIRSPLSSRDATLQFLSDGHTASSLIKLGYMHSLRGGRGYFLHFKHRTVEEEYPQRTGSVRGEDVPFWLGLPLSPLFPHNYTTQEKQISHLMLRYLANFAKTGNPNQSSLSSPLPSPSALITSPSSSISSRSADNSHEKTKRSSFNIVNATSSTSSGPIKSSAIVADVATAAAREALNLAVLYNQRRTKRTYYKRHSRSNEDHSGSASNEINYFLNTSNKNKLDSDELPFWDAYDVVNQLYMELGNKAEIQSHYRGHKLSMWLNLIPQLHRHANMNDQSMRHHQFQDDLNNLNLYEGIVRAQIQTKPDDDDENLLLPKGRPTAPPSDAETNTTLKQQGGTTECGVDGAMFVAEITTLPPSDNRSLVLNSREKEMATASTGLIGNLEVLRRLSGKQFQSYTTALVATVAVGCFLLILNILIFAGIYHQREKRARDAKTKEELQDNDTSKNSSMLKLNAMGSETGSFNGSTAGVSGKTTVLFGEYNCYDEKSLQTKDGKLMVELPPLKMVDVNWAACSTSTLDLLKTKHHVPLDTTYTLSNVMPLSTESQTEHLMVAKNLEIATYKSLPMASGLVIDPSFATTSSSGLLSKRGSFVGSSGQLNQYDFASVQSSDQMSFKDIENAVKASAAMNDNITQDDDIPEPPPPPRSFQNMQQQIGTNTPASASGSGSGGGGILKAGTTSATQTGGGKKRVHIQEISV